MEFHFNQNLIENEELNEINEIILENQSEPFDFTVTQKFRNQQFQNKVIFF